MVCLETKRKFPTLPRIDADVSYLGSMDIKTCQSLIKMHRCSTQFLIYFILFLFSQGKIDFTKNRISFHLIKFLGCYAQLCLEDGAVNEKLRDQRFIQRQLDCILAEHDQHCDQFGAH